MATTKTTALTFRIETDLKAAVILANPAVVLKGSLLANACMGVSRGLA